jgi:hypothetical protein
MGKEGGVICFSAERRVPSGRMRSSGGSDGEAESSRGEEGNEVEGVPGGANKEDAGAVVASVDDEAKAEEAPGENEAPGRGQRLRKLAFASTGLVHRR